MTRPFFQYLILRIQDYIWLSMIPIGFIAMYVSHNWDIRLSLYPSINPEFYKIISWCAFGLLFLRPIYGWKYGATTFFFYTLAESIGNTYYLLFHYNPMISYAISGSPFDPDYTLKLFMYPLIAVIILFTFRLKIHINRYSLRWFAPFIMFMLIWSIQGYHVLYDVCCIGPPYNMPNASLDGLAHEVIWNFLYLIAILGFISEQKK